VEKEPLEDEGVAVQEEQPADDDVTILEEMPFRGETSTPAAGDLSRAQARIDECLLRVDIICCSLVHLLVILFLTFHYFFFLIFFLGSYFCSFPSADG
jgi:hypothetical protein